MWFAGNIIILLNDFTLTTLMERFRAARRHAIMANDYNEKFLGIAFQDGTPADAFLTACAIGTLFAKINHKVSILIGQNLPLI